MLKKGAMFGLDARIALAIFGALSVISGAALYSAIEKSKVTKYVTLMQEHGKAWEAYYLDTGIQKAAHTGSNPVHVNYISNEELVSSTKPGWKGPYTSLRVENEYAFISNDETLFLLGKFRDDVQWTDLPENGEGVCVANANCFLWIQTYYDEGSVMPDSFFKAIDEQIDGSDGLNKGNFRTVSYTNSKGTFKTSYLKYATLTD